MNYFLVLLGYYGKVIWNLPNLFTKCKKGGKIEQTREFLRTFDLCKNILYNDPISQYPDFSRQFNMSTDAKTVSISIVLSQGKVRQDLHIAYA